MHGYAPTMTETTSRSCPTCGATLQQVHHEGVELDRCPDGHGLWLDRGELRRVVLSELADRPAVDEDEAHAAAARDAGHSVVAELARERRDCPVCSQPMRLTEYAASGIAIDECQAHGVWLDDGELEQIEAYAEGVRRLTGGGTIAGAGPVRGIDIPADLLATIRVANVPPPG